MINLSLRQTSCTLSHSTRHFRRNKVFRRDRDGLKRSPPALHLTLSLTLENNKKRVPRRPAALRPARSGGAHPELRAPITPCAAPIYPQLALSGCQVFSLLMLFSRPRASFDLLSSSRARCLLQLCGGNSAAVGRRTRCLLRCAVPRGLGGGARPNVPTHCEKYPHCILVSCQQHNYPEQQEELQRLGVDGEDLI